MTEQVWEALRASLLCSAARCVLVPLNVPDTSENPPFLMLGTVMPRLRHVCKSPRASQEFSCHSASRIECMLMIKNAECA